MAKKRERLELIYDILCAIRDNGNKIGPTRLLYSSNLSSQMFKDYIEELLDKGFIEEIGDSSRRYYSLKDKGYDFISKYRDMMRFMEGFGV